jgi:hypothetical protein
MLQVQIYLLAIIPSNDLVKVILDKYFLLVDVFVNLLNEKYVVFTNKDLLRI